MYSLRHAARHSLIRMGIAALMLWQVIGTVPAHAANLSFVTRSGNQLLIDGKAFRFSGANIFWLALDSDGGRTVYPSSYRVDDAFSTVSAMGGTVVRTQAALSTGCPMCIQPTRGTFNEAALRQLDLVLDTARTYNIRLVLPLVDNYHYFQGGKHDYTDWRGIGDENAFFTDQNVMNDFKHYVDFILNRVNTLNGVAYKDDPTILAWETGNELSLSKSDGSYNGPPPQSWTTDMANFIRPRARQLIMDGTNLRGKVNENHGFPNTPYAPTISNVDIYTSHYYYHADRPESVNFIPDLREDSLALQNAGRVFVAGEYDWTGKSNSVGTNNLPDFLATLEDRALGVDGDMYWSLMGHADNGGYETHNDGYTLQYPGGTNDVRTRAQQLRTHAYRMRSMTPPAHPIPGAPKVMASGSTIAWRGVAGADSYTIERSLSGPSGPWQVICAQCKDDWDAPFSDPTGAAQGAVYRMKAHNMSGVAGAYSTVPGGSTTPAGTTVVDNLADWSKTYSRSANLKIDALNAKYFLNDSARAARRTLTAEEISWKLTNMTSFKAITYFWNSEAPAHFQMFTSADGTTWKTATPTIAGGQGEWRQYVYTLDNLSNVNYVKMRWNTASAQAWASEISQVTMTGK